MPWDTQSVLGQAREEGAALAGSGQSVKVHRGQWLPPVAEVAVFRVGQVCARATGHWGEEELNHLTQPLISMDRKGLSLRAGAATRPQPLRALGKEQRPW